MTLPNISIVIPTYNHLEDCLKPCIKSVIEHSSNIEIIIVANGCTDGTREYVNILQKTLSNIKLVWSNDALGYTKATNEGIKVASGEYIILLNNDTVILDSPKDTWLKMLYEPFKNPKTGISGPSKLFCHEAGREFLVFFCVMIKREVFNNVGLLDEIFTPGGGEDIDICIKAEDYGYTVSQIPEETTAWTYATSFPIYHRAESTMYDLKGWDDIFKNNMEKLRVRYKKPIKYSIVIPTYNHCDDYLKPCIDSLKKYTDYSECEIIIVANGCTDGTKEYLKNLSPRGPYVTVWSDKGLGYTKATNEGIKIATGEYVILLNNDLVLLPQPKNQWIKLLEEPFLNRSSVGITGPVKFNWDCNGITRHAMAFWCVMMERVLFDEIGLLDEIYNPGMGEDGDFSIKANLIGYDLVQVPDDISFDFVERKDVLSTTFPIWHKGNGTFSDPELKKDFYVERNKKILEERFGNELEKIYDMCLHHKCDINEHFPTLRRYAQKCKHITEFGVRGVFSTYAFLASTPKVLNSYDIELYNEIWQADKCAKDNGIKFSFFHRDVLKVEIEPTDLLFIDTLHVYRQLKQELVLHEKNVRKYIILHDTTSFGEKDEIPLEGEGNGPGLWKAIEEFLTANPNWEIRERHINNNGLTVLERIKMNEQQKPNVSIIIPTYNHLEDCLKPCIDSLKKFTNLADKEVIIVANGCTDGTREYVEALGVPFKLLWNEEALGYTKATNWGIKESLADYTVLLNNDTVLLEQPTDDWINKLLVPFKEDPTVGLTGPLELHDDYANFDVLIFFCVMVKKELFEKIGLLDEIFTPGGGEDIDFTVRAVQAGYKSVKVPTYEKLKFTTTNVGDFPIWHKGGGTFGSIPIYSKHIVKRNGLINMKRYNKNVKLNLGSGGVEIPGYLSVDMNDQRASIIMDVCELELDDNSVTEIIASHLFEHINPYKSYDLLVRWLKVLKPGGKLIMEMPDIEQLCNNFHKNDYNGKFGLLNCVYGAVNTQDTGDKDHITAPHLWGWWPEALFNHMNAAGFVNIVFGPEQIPHPGHNFRVEANKPK